MNGLSRFWAGVVTVAVSVSILAGCAPAEKETPVTMSIDQAKSEYFSMEDELIALVPDDIVTESFPRSELSAVIF